MRRLVFGILLITATVQGGIQCSADAEECTTECHGILAAEAFACRRGILPCRLTHSYQCIEYINALPEAGHPVDATCYVRCIGTGRHDVQWCIGVCD